MTAPAGRLLVELTSGSSPDVPDFGLVGRDPALVAAVQLARKVAASAGTTVLVGGETGTGKELIARGIHRAGRSCDAPFVAINCSAIPDSLLEGELFGHEPGAYTGARETRPGLAEAAGSGTLFLDEIGEMPLSLQPKLLRLLEERTTRRLGSTRELPVRCRIVAGTNVQLERAVAEGRFREDLYYRLNVIRVDLPPLRERVDDILPLAGHFVREIAHRRGGPPKVIDASAGAALVAHHWPGNVRELRNVMERATLLVSGPVLRRTDIAVPVRHAATTASRGTELGRIAIPEGGKSLAEIEREAIRLTMLHTAGNLSAAARILGISRPTLTRRLRDSGLTRRSLLAST